MIWVAALLTVILVFLLFRLNQLDQKNQRLLHLLNFDELTGVHSRRSLMHSIESHLDLVRKGVAVQLVFLDMNGLKALNSEGGHAAGDLALRNLGSQLVQFSERGEFVARYGGDEFVLLLLGVGEEVDRRLTRLNDTLGAGEQFTWAISSLSLTSDLMTQINSLSMQVLGKKLDAHT